FVASFSALADFLVDWLWFDALGFGAVFLTILRAQVMVGAGAVALAFGLLALNGLLAVRVPASRVQGLRLIRRDGGKCEGLPVFVEFEPATLPWRYIVLIAAGVLGVFIGLTQASNWQIFLRWLHGVPFGRSDPVFGKDLSFYVFTLPLYKVVRNWGFL